ncbi:MAG: PAS domain S-box protein [Candidatus Omnitrophota bacterium]|jgi:PAS domain S-box-containing protein|nr:MAG: PAS domain S-box protein [Candidatus Omnitrophota bacterium]
MKAIDRVFLQVLYFVINCSIYVCHLSGIWGHELPSSPDINTSIPIWRIEVLTDDLQLRDRNIFYIDFEPDGVAWIATSVGLYRYDGYRWKCFTETDGLPSSFVRCVHFDRSGRLWVGTNQGAGVFDGQTFSTLGSENGLAGPSVRRIREEEDGTLWFCSDRWMNAAKPGGLASLQDGIWTQYGPNDGILIDSIYDFLKDTKGDRYALTNRTLYRQDGERWIEALQEQGISLHLGTLGFWSICESENQEILLSTNSPLYILHQNQWRRHDLHNPQSYRLFATRKGEIITLGYTPDKQYGFLKWDGSDFQLVSQSFEPSPGTIESINEAPDGSIWCTAYSYLVRWDRSENGWMQMPDDLPLPQLVDHKNRIWFTNGQKICRWDQGTIHEIQPPVTSVKEDSQNRIWGLTNREIICWNEDLPQIYSPADSGFALPLFGEEDKKGNLWFVGQNKDLQIVLSRFQNDTWTPLQLDSSTHWELIQCVTDPISGLWLMFRDAINGVSHLYYAAEDGSPREIELIPEIPPFARIKFFMDSHRRVWMYGVIGLFCKTDISLPWEQLQIVPGQRVRAIGEHQNVLWIGYTGDLGGQAGWSQCIDGAWTHVIDDFQEFFANTYDGTSFLGGRNRLYIAYPNEESLPCPLFLPDSGVIRSVVKDRNGILWIGIGNRVYRYVPQPFLPDCEIISGKHVVRKKEVAEVLLRGIARFHSMNNPSLVFQFSHRLDQGSWSKFATANSIQIPADHLAIGPHRLEILARDPHLNLSMTPAVFDFEVKSIPLQDHWWFPPLVLFVFGMIAFLALFLFIARQKLSRYAHRLEEMVADRTASLKESEEHFRTVIESSTDAIIEIDAEGLIILFNPAAELIFGYRQEEMIGNPLDSLMTEDLCRLHGEYVKSFFETGSPNQAINRSVELTAVRKNGETFPIDLSLSAGHRSDGPFVLAIIRDVQERKKIDERLRQTQKMEAVGMLAGGIAHDFNNLLTGILGYSDILLSRIDQNHANYNALSSIRKAGESAAALTRQLLAFSRKQILDMKVINLNDLVKDMEKLIRRLIGEDIEFKIITKAVSATIKADPNQIEQILMNLVVNARDAMPYGGKITIETDDECIVDGFKNQKVSVEPGPYVKLAVSDTGCGMDKNTQERIFEPFFTTKEKGKGTGLGLSTVYGNVKQSEGYVFVYSEIGKGTTLQIYFPQVNEMPMHKKPVEVAIRSLKGAGSILIVEDEEIVRRMITDVLQSAGYTVYVTGCFEEARERFLSHIETIQLLITDVVLPRISGRVLADQFQSMKEELQVIYISGYTENAIVHHGVLEEGINFLQKPFTPYILLRKIEEVMERI